MIEDIGGGRGLSKRKKPETSERAFICVLNIA